MFTPTQQGGAPGSPVISPNQLFKSFTPGAISDQAKSALYSAVQPVLDKLQTVAGSMHDTQRLTSAGTSLRQGLTHAALSGIPLGTAYWGGKLSDSLGPVLGYPLGFMGSVGSLVAPGLLGSAWTRSQPRNLGGLLGVPFSNWAQERPALMDATNMPSPFPIAQ
jgi:hypothetical protein